MKIMFVHNFYGSSAPSGENEVVLAERNLLDNRGHEIVDFFRQSDEIIRQGAIGVVRGALATPWNPWMGRCIRKAVESYRPDVVHVHNTFPLISPSIFKAIGRRAARVLTLHNYRLFCAAGVPARQGKVCTECLDRRYVGPALKNRCYRNNFFATLPVVSNISLNRWLGTWTNEVDGYIALTEFQKQRMVNAGLPAHKVHVKPNFFPGSPSVKPWSERNACVVFVGRLSAEKGVSTLIRAWKIWGDKAPELRIIGDGPLRKTLESFSAGSYIRFLGRLSALNAQTEIASASLLVLPSECFEGFPMVVREAFAFGTPVAVSNLGPLPSIIRHMGNGLVFPAGDANALQLAIKDIWGKADELKVLSKGARFDFERMYNESSNYDELMGIYQKAISENRRGWV